jgi:hypothetical protein
LYSVIVPIAFAACSITSMGIVVTLGHLFEDASQPWVFTEPLAGIKGVGILLLIYVVPGVVGAWIVVAVLRRFNTRQK